MKNNSKSLTRRSFVSTIMAAGAALPFIAPGETGYSSGDTYSPGRIHIFSKCLQWLGYEEMAQLLAEAGAGGIDLTVRTGGHVLPENVANDLPKAVEAARRYGLAVDMIVTEITRTDEKYTESVIRTASGLGIKYYRLGYINYDDQAGVWGTLQKYKPELKKLEEMNRKYSIHGAYQNHSGARVGGPVWDLYELMKDLDPEYIGCQYDVRHAVAEGGYSWVNGMKLIAPWVKCTDLKDFKWSVGANGKWGIESVPIGKGMVNFDEYFKIVKKTGISGPASIHLEYPPFERYNVEMEKEAKKKLFITEMKKDIDAVKTFFRKYEV